MVSSPAKPAAKKKPGPKGPKPVYGKPEKPNRVAQILAWAFVVLGVGGIIWMVAANPPQKQLVCEDHGPNSLIGFGNCHEE